MSSKELKEVGLKVTLPRLNVLRVLKQSTPQYLTAEDIYTTLIEQDEGIGLATVYRVLAQFEEAGLIQRLNFEGSPTLYTLATGNTYNHLVCSTSGKIGGFIDPVIDRRIKEIAKDKGFKVDKYSLTVYGTFEE